MPFADYTTFSLRNRRLILRLCCGHLLWSLGVFGLQELGGRGDASSPWLMGGFVALQFFAAAQLLLPALRLESEPRSRGFYFFWALILALAVWLIGQPVPFPFLRPLQDSFQAGLLLLAGNLVGVALARYVNRLWEILPVCLVMSLADFSSWLFGPTAGFSRQIRDHYLAPEGPPPVIDMFLVKLAFPGVSGLFPVFGLSDWIMAVFFAGVARRYGLNDNLLGALPAEQGGVGRFLPLSVAALLLALVLAQASGRFVPALPLMALVMLLWYLGTRLLQRSRTSASS